MAGETATEANASYWNAFLFIMILLHEIGHFLVECILSAKSEPQDLNATGKVAEFEINHKISIQIASTCKSSLRCPAKTAQNLSEFGSFWHKHLCVPKGRGLIRYFRTVKKPGCQKQMLLHEIFICVKLDLERRSFAPGGERSIL